MGMESEEFPKQSYLAFFGILEPWFEMLDNKRTMLPGSETMNLIYNADQLVSTAEIFNVAFPNRFDVLYSCEVCPES